MAPWKGLTQAARCRRAPACVPGGSTNPACWDSTCRERSFAVRGRDQLRIATYALSSCAALNANECMLLLLLYLLAKTEQHAITCDNAVFTGEIEQCCIGTQRPRPRCTFTITRGRTGRVNPYLLDLVPGMPPQVPLGFQSLPNPTLDGSVRSEGVRFVCQRLCTTLRTVHQTTPWRLGIAKRKAFRTLTLYRNVCLSCSVGRRPGAVRGGGTC